MVIRILPVWLAVLCYIVLVSTSATVALNIIRGITDKFTNPGCTRGSCNDTSSNCVGFVEAYCVAPGCLECQCNFDYPTFYQKGNSDGKCVKNEMLLDCLDDDHSFLAYLYKGLQLCILPYSNATDSVTADQCDVNNGRQHWIWTQYNQLLNLHTLKCLQASKIPGFTHEGRTYPKVSLTLCNASNLRQIWKCDGEVDLVYLSYEQAYLNYGSVRTYVIVFSGTGTFSRWNRYKSGRSLCSNVSSYQGCYKYSDGSSVFTIETETLPEGCGHLSETCEKEKDISAPIEVTNKHCSIEWKRTEFLNHTRWHYLPGSVLEGKPLRLEKRNMNTITLKVNLKRSRELIGQIIRLYIRCESKSFDRLKHQKSSIKQGENETHCVLIKFSGSFRSMFSEKMSTTTAAHDTNESEGVSLTNVVIIVVCVVLILLIAAVSLFVLFKLRRCRAKQENETSDHMYENTAQHFRAKSAESLNPIYSSGNNITATHQEEPSDAFYGYEVPVHAVSSECQLYEPSANENMYHEPETVLNRSQPALEYAYDYAKPDGVNPTVSNNFLYAGERSV